MIKTLFLGSNWEALSTFQTLVNDKRFEMVGLITQPDKPVGRKQIIMPSEIKQFALDNNIPVYHTESDPERYKQALELFKPELIVCKSFGEIIPGFFLDYPKFKSINVHYSLLPKYRGAVPIQMAILNGEDVTGITIVQMVEKIDAGPILAEFEESIRADDTNQSLRERLVEITTKVLPDILISWTEGKIKATDQNDSEATMCWKKDIEKEKAEIKWSEMEPEYIERMVRAFIPWPVAWTTINEKRTKIFEVKLDNSFTNDSSKPAGTFFEKDGKLYASTKDPSISLEITKLQLEGKNEMLGRDFIRGRLLK